MLDMQPFVTIIQPHLTYKGENSKFPRVQLVCSSQQKDFRWSFLYMQRTREKKMHFSNVNSRLIVTYQPTETLNPLLSEGFHVES